MMFLDKATWLQSPRLLYDSSKSGYIEHRTDFIRNTTMRI